MSARGRAPALGPAGQQVPDPDAEVGTAEDRVQGRRRSRAPPARRRPRSSAGTCEARAGRTARPGRSARPRRPATRHRPQHQECRDAQRRRRARAPRRRRPRCPAPRSRRPRCAGARTPPTAGGPPRSRSTRTPAPRWPPPRSRPPRAGTRACAEGRASATRSIAYQAASRNRPVPMPTIASKARCSSVGAGGSSSSGIWSRPVTTVSGEKPTRIESRSGILIATLHLAVDQDAADVLGLVRPGLGHVLHRRELRGLILGDRRAPRCRPRTAGSAWRSRRS